MDPQANIEEQRSLARAIIERIDGDGDDRGRLGLRTAEHVADLAGQLAERVLALDEWRRAGGFDPYGRTRPPQELAWPVRQSSDEGEGNDEEDDQRGGRSG